MQEEPVPGMTRVVGPVLSMAIPLGRVGDLDHSVTQIVSPCEAYSPPQVSRTR